MQRNVTADLKMLGITMNEQSTNNGLNMLKSYQNFFFLLVINRITPHIFGSIFIG